ncbi:MAG: AMP phosphorylase [Thermoplasmata archaeon]|nr:AMP phosphorylase [Thermoplasmata archaeon]
MKFKIKEIKIDAGELTVILNNKDAKDMGVRSLDRVKLITAKKTITAVVELSSSVVKEGHVGVLLKVFEELKTCDTDTVEIMPTERPHSVELIKHKIEGKTLSAEEIREIVVDIAAHNLTDIELTAYVVACQLNGMNLDETTYLTKAMVETGDTIELDRSPVFDFHSIGGAPGNKITLLVVPIVAAAGLLIPKTSSRAISSACGTADIFETIARVSLTKEEIKNITETIGGVIAWGGNVNFAPADDIIIRVEYPLSLDPYSQLIASVMAKKKAVGADFFLLDIPIGPGTKVTETELANKYASDFIEIGRRLDMHVECAITYGGQPIGKHIGPLLEAKEALMCLEGKAPSTSVVEKSVAMAGILLEMGGMHNGKQIARDILDSGKALEKFREILQAQDGNPDLKSEDISPGQYKAEILSSIDGYVISLDNKKLVRIARTAGSPRDKGAGLVFLKKRGEKVDRGESMYEIYADNQHKLDAAVNLTNLIKPYTIEGMIISHVPGRGRATNYSKH